MPQTELIKQHTFISHGSEGCKEQDQGPGRFDVW